MREAVSRIATQSSIVAVTAHRPVRSVAALNAVLRERLLEVGIEPQGGSNEMFAAHLASEFAQWAKVAREANIAVE